MWVFLFHFINIYRDLISLDLLINQDKTYRAARKYIDFLSTKLIIMNQAY